MGAPIAKAPVMRQSQIRSSQRVLNRISLWILALLAFASPAASQTYTLAPSPHLFALDASGNIINAGCVWTYLTGTSTPAATYTTSAGTANANPIIAGSNGQFVAFLQPGTVYRFVYEAIPCSASSHGSVLATRDGVAAVPVSGLNVDVSGTAGETLTLADLVYLSATDGSWYRADADATATSTTAVAVGFATAAASSGASVTVRLAGRMTGLSLTAGDVYYVSATAAALTATPPTNTRCVGKADSTTTLILPCGESALSYPRTPQGRCTLTSATPVTTSDVTAATTLYYALYGGHQITLYDGSERWVDLSFSELSIAVPATTATMYDVFVDYTAGVPALEAVAWTNDTTRATALALQNGVYVQTADTDSLYVCSFRTTGVSGQTEHSFAKRYVWNYYNRVPQPMRVIDTANSWTYSTATWRQADANAANQLDFVVGVAEVMVNARVMAFPQNDMAAGSTYMSVGIGVDSTSAVVASQVMVPAVAIVAGMSVMAYAEHVAFSAVGRHTWVWLEQATAAGTTSWIGDNGSTTRQSGMVGWVEG